MPYFFIILLAGALGLESIPVFAQGPLDALDYVAGPSLTPNIAGGAEFGSMAQNIARQFLPFLNLIAVLTIVISGSLAVVAQDENRIQKSQNAVIMALVAIVLVNSAAAIARAYTTAFNFDVGADAAGGASIISTELMGLVSWLEVPVAIFAVLAIIISGIRTVIDYGTEKGLGELRKTVISVLFGIVLIVAKFALGGAVVSGNPDGMLNVAIKTTILIVSYTALAAVAVIVLAGIYMIANLGNEDQYSKAKSLIVRVLVGIVVMLVSVGVILAVMSIG